MMQLRFFAQLGCAAVLAVIFFPRLLVAELPPGEYDTLRRHAREVVQLRIVGISELDKTSADTREFLCEAKVLVVERSLQGLVEGGSIKFITYSVRPEAWSQGFSGPRSPAVPTNGWTGRVYLNTSRRNTEAPFEIAAYGASFVRLAKVPAIPDVLHYQVFVKPWRASLYHGEKVIAQVAFASQSKVEQIAGNSYLTTFIDMHGRTQRAWIRRSDVLVQPPFEGYEVTFRDRLQEEEHSLAILEGQLKYTDAINSAYGILISTRELYGVGHPFHTAAIRHTAALNGSCKSINGDDQSEKATHKRAIELYCRAIELDSKVLGKAHPMVGRTLFELGALCERHKDYKSAELAYHKCIEILNNSLGADHVDTTLAKSHLGAVLNATKNYQEAERVYRALLLSRLRAHGDDDEATADVMEGLAETYRGLRSYTEAEALLRDSLRIWTARPEHQAQDIARVRASLQSLFQETGDVAKLRDLAVDKVISKEADVPTANNVTQP